MNVKEILLPDWDALLQHFEQLDSGWLFRGQLDVVWTLRSSLERSTPTDMKPSLAESRLLYEFRRRAHLYLQSHQVPAYDAESEWLALMQHFGAPTRLIDFTRSPYVATYFAVEDARDPKSAGAVWAVNKRWCLESAGNVVLKDNDPAERSAILDIAGRGTFSPGIIQGMRSSSLHGDLWRTKKIAVVVPFVPERLSERLSVQQGEFLVPRDVDLPFMDNLAAHENPENNLVKYIIPNERRGRILERLRIMNVTRAQLFPGLDGFAQLTCLAFFGPLEA